MSSGSSYFVIFCQSAPTREAFCGKNLHGLGFQWEKVTLSCKRAAFSVVNQLMWELKETIIFNRILLKLNQVIIIFYILLLSSSGYYY